ncbi:MAG TPA: RagB/SusD family nutrient uptake outer membrane protein [Balneolaceae bacterium]|nr:RagB/SusD family nutrient uptake outer membrane protein [Balneolaceae bacterium]
MSRLLKYLFVISTFILLATGCDLNFSPLNQISDADVWEDQQLIEAYINDMYDGLDHGYRENMLESVTDNASYLPCGADNYVRGVISASDMTAFGAGCGGDRMRRLLWAYNYDRIRDNNIFLEQIDNVGDHVVDEETRRRMKGEVHFFRAFHYHNLLRSYGGVPIVDKAYNLDDEMLVSRNSFEETVNFIVQDLERATELLPEVQPDKNGAGATKGAALALKTRVLLHAASDLYNKNPENELVGYTSGDQQQRWRAAKTAAQEVMDLGLYELYNRYPEDPSRNYGQIWLDNSDHEEAIMSRFFLSHRGDDYSIGLRAGPNGYHNWATNTPIQQFIDAFEMSDGSKFDWNNPKHASAPYENRDPRFYATVSYDGAKWSERPATVRQYEPNSIVQTFTSITIHEPDGSTRTRPGVDTRSGPVEDWNGSWTGYHMIKAIDPNVQHHQETQEIPWRFFRYAEVLLAFAEASIELGEEDDARWAINQIRNRAGMPDIVANGDELKQKYRNERRIEMSYEDQRFWDIRRWMIAPEVMNENGKAIEIHVEATDEHDRSTYFNYQYSVYEWQERNWNDRMYFMPISLQELNRNSNLKQNPGY